MTARSADFGWAGSPRQTPSGQTPPGQTPELDQPEANPRGSDSRDPASQDASSQDAERGGILALTLGALGIVAVLIVVIAVAGALYLDRRDLLALADATAADAAAALDTEAYAAGDIALTDESVRDAAIQFLSGIPTTARLSDPTGSPDGTTAEVTLTQLSRPSFLPWALVGWSEGITIEVTASAREVGERPHHPSRLCARQQPADWPLPTAKRRQ